MEELVVVLTASFGTEDYYTYILFDVVRLRQVANLMNEMVFRLWSMVNGHI